MNKRILIAVCALLTSMGITGKTAELTATDINNIVKDSTSEMDDTSERIFCESDTMGFIFKEEMDEASILHTGNIRVNDSVDIIKSIDIIDKRCLVITLKEQMQTDYRYIVEFYNIKTLSGTETQYTRFDTTIVSGYAGKTILCDEIKTTTTDAAATMTLPFILNAGTAEFTFDEIYATYTDTYRYENMQRNTITLKGGEYYTEISHTNRDKTKKTKLFIWQNGQMPICKEATE